LKFRTSTVTGLTQKTCNLALVLLICMIYSSALPGAWYLDDNSMIIGNKFVHAQSWQELPTAFRHYAGGEGFFRPVTFFTFAVNHLFTGLDPLWYRVTNICLHAIMSLVLLMFLRHILRDPIVAFLSAAMWAVHPIQTAAVSYIVQRSTILAALFGILGLYLYIRGREEGSVKKIVMSAVLFAIAFLCKENSATLLACAWLYDLFFIQKFKHLRTNLVAAACVAVSITVVGTLYVGLEQYAERPFLLSERLLVEFKVLGEYLSTCLLPVSSEMAAIYHAGKIPAGISAWVSAVLIFCIIGILIYKARRFPVVAFCGLWFFICHSVESTFLPLELRFDHRNYLPSMLLYVPVVMAFLQQRVRRFAIAAIIVVILSQAAVTYERNKAFILQPNVIVETK